MGSEFSLSNSQAELRFIADSSWAKQVEADDLDSVGLARGTMMTKCRLECLCSRSPARGSCEDFQSMIEDCNLIGVRSQGARSSRTKVERRLNMTLVSEGCTTRWQCQSVLFSFSIDGVISVDQTVIRGHIVRFYVDLFSSVSDLIDQDLSIVYDIVPSSVSQEENSLLVAIPSTDVIHDVVFSMDALSTPVPDGLSGRFFQRCWEIMGKYVILAVQDFFHSRVVSSKILADRLAQIAARIVSPQLFGFIRDQQVEDCIALAYDCVNVLHKKCYGGNVAMKIDIRKAFDTLD
ncbi:hypothetical protein Dsin_024311 [Dipteronia sinensis]|uniref:Reverse transcriptase domain-containing protein n=1 Tax=Dipteronia sinensis TaxID=43782 RepID=A0AAD9ZTY6_9ROSI|nr:hypothetical protein Dsin_024311 [Dipteronia sinensis]